MMRSIDINRKGIGLLFLTFILVAASFAQKVNILNEFKALNKHYANLKSFSMDIEMQYFDQSGKSVMRQKGNVVHSEDINYTKLGGRITLLLNTSFVSVNEESMRLIYNKIEENKNPPEESNIDISTLLDSLWESQTNFTYNIIQSKKGTFRVFISDSKSPYFDAYEILIDTKKHLLLEYTYYVKLTEEDDYLSKISISYSNETSRPKLNQDILKLKHYVVKKKKELVLTERFQNYQLIDQTKLLSEYE